MTGVSPLLLQLAHRIAPPEPAEPGVVLLDGEPHSREELASALYAELHCRLPADQRARDRLGSQRILPRDFSRQLSEANSGTGAWQHGWIFRGLVGNRCVVERDGVRYEAAPADVRESAAARDGGLVTVRVPREYRHLLPGFYVAIGNADDDLDRGASVRIYWNVDPAGALILMRDLTRAFNDASIPFRLKMPSDPREFGRADAVVLYMRREQFDTARPLVERATTAVRSRITPHTSLLVREIAPGVGAADEPTDGLSFGEQRSGILAEAFTRVSARARTAEERAAAAAAALTSMGFDPAALHLNPGSPEIFRTLDIPEASLGPATARFGSVSDDREQWRGVAVEIAHHLCESAIADDGRCTWMGTTQDEDEFGELEFGLETVGPSLYAGTSGIALFLAETWAITRDERLRSTAESALGQAVRGAQGLAAADRPGFFSGVPGIAWALARTARLLRSDSLRDEARSLAVELARDTSTPSGIDVIDGAAGSVPVLLTLAETLGLPELREAALRHAEMLISGDDPDLTGFAHGAAGIGSALIRLHAATGEARYLSAADRAFQFERRWFRPSADNWPDFREADSSDPSAPCAMAWCHGAPGIGLSRIGALLNDTQGQYRADLEAAVRSTSRAVRTLARRADADWSLCHGLAGMCEFLLRAADALGLDDARTLALETASDAARRYAGAPQAWPCGVARGSHPSLMIGLAGIALFFLRLAEPSVRIPLVPGER